MTDQTTRAQQTVFTEPTEPVPTRFILTLFVSIMVFYVALLGPAIVGVAIKVQAIVPDDQKTSAVGTVAGLGALAAVFGNVISGRLSDRTTSRWGRRRPWLVGGTVMMTAAFVVLGTATTVTMATIGWFLAQWGANAALAPMVATVADQVPTRQRGVVSALMGIALNVGIMGGVILSQLLAHHLVLMFVLPSLAALAAMVAYARVLPDQVLPSKPPPMSARDWLATFWVNPLRYPDFAWAWISRFMIVLSMFMFTTYRLFFTQDRLGVAKDDAPGTVTKGVMIYTLTLVVTAWVAGKVSDRLGRRKIFVAASSVLFGLGTAALAQVSTISGFYLVEAVLGVAFGIYVATDLALVTQVIPNQDDAGKDLGVFNIASASPQSLAPMVGATLLAIGSSNQQNYSLMLYIAGAFAILGALMIMPVKKVR